MRFMDAKPDGRAIVYAHIQADPLVARAADLLADATTTPARPRPRRHERRVDRRGRLAGDVPDAVRRRRARAGRPGTRPVRGDPRRLARGRRPRGADPVASSAGRSSRRSTERLLAERTAPVRRERRILFDGRPAEIHPYDVTVEARAAPPRPGTASGARGDQGGRPPPARRRAAWCRGRGDGAASSGWSCSTRGARARSASSGSAARWRSRASSSSRWRGSTGWRAARAG